MLDPFALSAIAGAISGFATIGGAISDKNQMDYQAAVAEQEAEMIRRKNIEDEKLYLEQFESLLGEQRAAAAATGIVSDAGSGLLIQRDAYTKYLRDRQRRSQNAAIESSARESEADALRSAGRAGLVTTGIGAIGQNVGNYARMRLRYRQP